MNSATNSQTWVVLRPSSNPTKTLSSIILSMITTIIQLVREKGSI